MKKIIEFVYQNKNSLVYQPHLLSIDVSDISFVQQINQYNCEIYTKNNQSFCVFGSYRVITNRISYTLEKEIKIFEDIIIRPSISLQYKLTKLEVSDILLDPAQAKAFIDAYYYQKNIDNIYIDLLPHTYESILELPENFWKI